MSQTRLDTFQHSGKTKSVAFLTYLPILWQGDSAQPGLPFGGLGAAPLHCFIAECSNTAERHMPWKSALASRAYYLAKECIPGKRSNAGVMPDCPCTPCPLGADIGFACNWQASLSGGGLRPWPAVRTRLIMLGKAHVVARVLHEHQLDCLPGRRRRRRGLRSRHRRDGRLHNPAARNGRNACTAACACQGGMICTLLQLLPPASLPF